MKKKKIARILLLLVFSLCTFEKIEYQKNIDNQWITQTQKAPPINETSKEKNTEEFKILEIPKIHLKQPFYEPGSSLNKVSKNIEQISTCELNENCTIILAAHSGTSSISYFKNLDQLSIKDLAYIYENNQKYTYQLKKISYQRKNGSISIPKQTYDLVLTTCNKQNQELQNIYLFQKI